MAAPDSQKEFVSARAAGLHLGMLTSLAVAQPLYDLLARYPTFLVAHRMGPGEIYLLIALLSVAVPIAVVALGLVMRAMGRGPYLLLLAVLVAVIVLPPLIRAVSLPGGIQLALALALAASSVVAYQRWPGVRRVFSVLSASWILFPLLFVADPSIDKLLHPVAPEFRAAGGGSDIPVVVVVFDELPVVSLMDGSRRVDAVRYPNFAALAGDSTWFRNTSTVAASTKAAIPAILTGRNPEKDQLPILADHPVNLFTLLQGSHVMHVSESLSYLWPESATRDASTGRAGDRRRQLIADFVLLYLHLLLPAEMAETLPSVSETWTGFVDLQATPGAESARSGQVEGMEQARKHAFSTRTRDWVDFVNEIGPEESAVLHFIHSPLPHVPWIYTPSGRRYADSWANIVAGKFPNSEKWGPDDWYVSQGQQRHLMQLAFVDRLLGRLLNRLESVGLYDRALVIVTADHGASFWPGGSRRNAEGAVEPTDILDVPLFIKRPHQSEPEIVDRHVRTIDILPTIADLLGHAPPANADGRSVFEIPPATFAEKRILSIRGRWHEFAPDPDVNDRSLAQKLARFGEGHETLYSLGSRDELVGRRLRALDPHPDPAVSITLHPSLMKQLNKLQASMVPAYLYGFVQGARVEAVPRVAISVNGVIQAVVPTLPVTEDTRHFFAMLPEETFPPGPTELRFLLVRAGPTGSELIANSRKPTRFEMPAAGASF